MDTTTFFKLTRCQWTFSGTRWHQLIYVNMRDISTMAMTIIGDEKLTEITFSNGNTICVLESMESIMEMFKEAYKEV